jgi:hypothetical protein
MTGLLYAQDLEETQGGLLWIGVCPPSLWIRRVLIHSSQSLYHATVQMGVLLQCTNPHLFISNDQGVFLTAVSCDLDTGRTLHKFGQA